jgi:hypothetical protein
VIEQSLDHDGMCTMRAMPQRILAIVAMALLAGTAVATMAALSPTTAGLISPASAHDRAIGNSLELSPVQERAVQAPTAD